LDIHLSYRKGSGPVPGTGADPLIGRKEKPVSKNGLL